MFEAYNCARLFVYRFWIGVYECFNNKFPRVQFVCKISVYLFWNSLIRSNISKQASVFEPSTIYLYL